MKRQLHILVTGANGQLGNECRLIADQFPSHTYKFVSRDDISITDMASLDNLFSQYNFDYCINCAAYTAVDKAESEKETAFAINAYAVGNLAAVCAKYATRLIHISTDYVFNGEKMTGYSESDETGPVSVYGYSKLEGEQLALKNNPETIIIRTSWVYSSFGKNFVKTMIRIMKERESIHVVNDQFGSPTYAADLADAIFTIINKEEYPPAGIYHYCNAGVATWFDFAAEIKKLGGFQCVVNPIPTAAYPTAAKRPHYSILLTAKIQHTFGIQVPHWKDSLKKCMEWMNP